MINNIDKKDRWFMSRHSRFTASMIYKLLGTGKDGRGFSEGGNTYIQEKAIETLTDYWDKPALEFVEPLLWGKMYEEPAFNHYISITKNYSMKYFGSDNPVYLPFNKHSGGSPDALMGNDSEIFLGAEIKAPANSKNHFLYLKMNDQYDLKQKRIEYYGQIQFLMLITKAPEFHFVSYDERFKDDKLKMKIIQVMPDRKFQDNLEIRIAMAQKEKNKIIKELTGM